MAHAGRDENLGHMGEKRKRNYQRITKTCLNCGEEFSIPPCRDWREHCCSSECKKEHREKLIKDNIESRNRVCLTCGKTFTPRQTQIDIGQGKYCTIECAHKGNIGSKRSKETKKRMSKAQNERSYRTPKGKENKCWKPYGISGDGYKWIWVDGKHVFEHRHVVEQHIGRKLNSDEIIHHVNEDKLDNRIENLLICTRAEHMKIHLHDKNK